MESQYLQWDIETIELKLKYAWKISRNTSFSKQNLIIYLNNQAVGEAAPNVRWGETIEKIAREFESIRSKLPKKESDLTSFSKSIQNLAISNSLKCALDMACTSHFLSKKSECETSYSLPILDIHEYEEFIVDNQLNRFKTLKIKLDNNLISERISKVKQFFSGDLFVDFNEAFFNYEEIKPHVQTLNENIMLVEQPFREGSFLDNKKLKNELIGDLFLDEDITDKDILPDMEQYCDGVNVKIQKAGGPSRAAQLLAQAKSQKLKTMVGCMVETSLGISHSMRLNNVDFYDLDGSLMILEEPFSLCFEKNGVLY